ncbi:MAG: hypothetical protein ACRDKG_09060 [Actinomycetota bacterium]
MTLRTHGRYGFQAVGGLVEPAAANHWVPAHGIPMAMEYAFGSLRAADGTYWWGVRGSYRDRARFLHLGESDPGQDFRFLVDAEGYMGSVIHEERDGWWGVWLPDGSSLIATDGPIIRWTEPDILDVEGELIGDAIQLFAPDAQEPLVYTSRPFRVSGTVRGTPVTGLLFHDSMHMPDGQNFITSSYVSALEAAWVAFATEFEDGTIQSGHLVWGTQDFAILIVQRSDGPSIVLRDLSVEVTFDGAEPEFPRAVRFTGGGETWLWEAFSAGGRLPVRKDLPDQHRWTQGWVHREGETRRPVSTEAMMETYNDRLADVRMGA